MAELEWDDELARGAKLHAEECDFNHDKADTCRFKVGQNLYISGDGGTPVADWSRPVMSWYDEVKQYRGDPTGPYQEFINKCYKMLKRQNKKEKRKSLL